MEWRWGFIWDLNAGPGPDGRCPPFPCSLNRCKAVGAHPNPVAPSGPPTTLRLFPTAFSPPSLVLSLHLTSSLTNQSALFTQSLVSKNHNQAMLGIRRDYPWTTLFCVIQAMVSKKQPQLGIDRWSRGVANAYSEAYILWIVVVLHLFPLGWGHTVLWVSGTTEWKIPPNFKENYSQVLAPPILLSCCYFSW
jgi:hypothetical protein